MEFCSRSPRRLPPTAQRSAPPADSAGRSLPPPPRTFPRGPAAPGPGQARTTGLEKALQLDVSLKVRENNVKFPKSIDSKTRRVLKASHSVFNTPRRREVYFVRPRRLPWTTPSHPTYTGTKLEGRRQGGNALDLDRIRCRTK